MTQFLRISLIALLLHPIFAISQIQVNYNNSEIGAKTPNLNSNFNTLSLPINKEFKIIKPINDLQNEDLQCYLEEEINQNKLWQSLIKRGNMSIAIVDLSDINNIQYAGINDSNMMYAASLPKIAILLASMAAIDEGLIEETDEVKSDMRLMISKSSNQAATRMIDRVGYEKIESVLRAPQYKLYDEAEGGGLWVGKRYAAAGKRHPDPMKGLSHAATTRQVCSFYYQMAMGNLINSERSKQMLEIMKNPELHHKFVNTLDKIAPTANVYRKSGSWKDFHSDSVLVWGPDRSYILVALIQNDQGEQIIRNLVEPVERVLKKTRA